MIENHEELFDGCFEKQAMTVYSEEESKS